MQARKFIRSALHCNVRVPKQEIIKYSENNDRIAIAQNQVCFMAFLY